MAQQLEKWGLLRCVEYARKNNITVKQADIQARISGLQQKQAGLYRFPSANFTSNFGPQFGRSISPYTNTYVDVDILSQNYTLQGNVVLYNSGRLNNSITASSFSFEAALMDVEKARNDISLNVATVYLQCLSTKEQTRVYKTKMEQSLKQIDYTRKRVDAGVDPELNLLELASQSATDSSNYTSALGEYQQSLQSLKSLLNLDAALPFDIETPSFEQLPLENLADLTPESVYQLAMANQPQQKSIALKIKAAEKNAEANRAAMYPSILASYSLYTNYSNQNINYLTGKKYPYFNQIFNQNFGQAVSLGLNVPIFNNGQYRTAYENSKLTIESNRLEQEQSNRKLKLDIYTAYQNAVNALQKYNASTRAVEAAQKAYDFSLKRFEVGLFQTLNLLTNQNNLSNAKIQMLINKFEYAFRIKVLEFYKGQGIKL